MDKESTIVTFGYTTDWHLCSRRPAKRIDEDFFINQLVKVKNFVDIMIDRRVQFCVHGGDVFDIPILPDFSLVNSIIPDLTRLKKEGIPFYINLGSHDVLGYNMAAVDKTAVGNLIKNGLMTVLSGPVTLCGINFCFIPATMKHSLDTYKDIPPKAVIVTHNMLVPESVPYDHILLSDLNFCSNLFLCGHYHKHFSKRVANNIFINPGPLVRTSISEATHRPNISIITADTKINLKTIYLACGTNVFDLFDVTDSGDTKFSLTVKNTKFEFYDLFELTNKLGQDNNISPEIIAEVIRRINDAKIGLRA